MRAKNYVLVLVVAAVLLTAGCLGGKTVENAGTVTVEKNRTVTETTTTTKIVPVENRSSEMELAENLSKCNSQVLLLQQALNQTMERLKNLSESYKACLVEVESQRNTSKSLKACEDDLARTREKLRETTAELESCRERLENMSGNTTSVELLPDEEYYRRAISAIDNSRESVYVMMFLMKYDPGDSFDWANDLIQALVSARRRGVEVHVLLEDSLEDNREAYEYLRSNGVDVSFDSPQTTLHAKAIVVDGEIVFIGSHNWSESALYWNHEVSVRIRSREMAERVIAYFEDVRREA